MDKVEKLTEDLKRAIVESEEYKEYIAATRELERYPDLKRALDEFRRENFRCHNSEDVGDVISASLEINDRYAELRKQPIAAKYLMAEMCVNRMIQRICMSVVDIVELDTMFLMQ